MQRATFAILFALGLVSHGFGQVIGVGGGDAPTTGATATGGQTVGGIGSGGAGGGGAGGGAGGAGIGQGQGGFGGGFGAGGTDEFGTSLGTDAGFVGQNLNAQQGAFIGANQAANGQGQQGPGGQFGNAGGGRGGAGGFGAGRGQGQGQQPQQRNPPRNIRIKITLSPEFAAAYRVVSPQKLKSRLTRQYQRIDSIQKEANADFGLSRVFRNANVSVTANGRSVTLRGQVASEREKSLAARIARLEPGVDRVENQLVVAP